MNQHERLVVTLDDLPNLLPFIPAEHRDIWVKVGMGIKSEFGEQGFDYWDKWSTCAANYDHKASISTWKSIKETTKKGSPATMGSVVQLAMQYGWKPEKKELSKADKARLKKEQAERRAAAIAKQEADEQLLAVMRPQLERCCKEVWEKHSSKQGASAYLKRKQVNAYGIRFITHSVMITSDSQKQIVQLLTGAMIGEFFNCLPKPRPDHISFIRMDRGGMVIPLYNEQKHIVTLQYINANGTKMYPRYSPKSGAFYVLGKITNQTEIIQLAEGYATAASCYEATGYPTVQCFDAGNLLPVGKVFKRLYPQALQVYCGDDDAANPVNDGREKAEEAAKLMGAVAVFPLRGEG